MNLCVVIQRKSGEMGIGHQFALSARGLEALRHVSEVVGAGVEVNEMRLLEPVLDKRDCLAAWHRRRHYRRTGRQSDESDRDSERDAYGFRAGQQTIPPSAGGYMPWVACGMRVQDKVEVRDNQWRAFSR